jgi:hypothetical protein
MTTPDISPVAASLAVRITPALVRSLEERKESFIARAGGFVMRQAVKVGWPVAMRELPGAVEAGVDALLDEFGTMTITDVASRLIAHQQAKGRPVNATLRRQG